MIARLQRSVMLMAAAATLLWVAYWTARGDWLEAAMGLFVPLMSQPAVLAIEFFLMLPAVNRDEASLPTFGQLVAAWWRESLTAYAVFNWRQPFFAGAEPDYLGDAVQGRRAVVLVHGFFCNRGLWNPWMQKLRGVGVPFSAITLEPAFGDIDDYVPLIDRAVAQAYRATGLPPMVVGHSMGGIAVRAWLRAQGYDGEQRVAGVVTIGSPHGGTFTARFSRAVNARQMGIGSSWLAALSASETPQRRAKFTCFYSRCDNIVMPASNATLRGAVNLHVACQPHVGLAFAPQVFDEVLRLVRGERLNPM